MDGSPHGRHRSPAPLIVAALACLLIPPQTVASPHKTKTAVGDSRRGEGLYQASCVVCHGSRANGGVGPKLAGNPVLSNDQAFWKVVHEGRHVMPPLKDVISDQQFADIRAWLRTLP
jgi:mono/diheme cytochrome c family protein